METFLAQIQRQAFRMAQLATGNEADALDIVQDAMMKLVQRYQHKPSDEWRPLFFRILEHRILDWHRKETLKRRWFFWKKPTDNEDSDEQIDLLEQHPDDNEPIQEIATRQLSEQLLDTLRQLPVKQQQCFLLRSWEGLSVAETAHAMGITEGSVKTHYFRARQKLQQVADQHET